VRRTGPKTHIEASPDSCSGKPRVAGTRVRVQDIVACHESQGMSPDEIVSGYPHLTLADVHAALTYYHDHRDEVRRQMKEDEDFVAEFRRNRPGKGRNGKDADADPPPL
jgi:uncharacterized protein (DUF433 family)